MDARKTLAERNAARLPNDTTVMVRHDLGLEQGRVLSSSRIMADHEQARYTIEFADGTISSWGENFLTAVAS